jgi:serine/threonine protein kinase/DNA-binding SARP family transcriptional activator/pimeloyl-ACP methyl ester carboxylesterase
MTLLQLSVFGSPRLERDGRPIELNLRKALALLVYLAVSGQPHSRDALATMLWPESDQREGRARLRRTLHRLTHALDEDVLEANAESIRLRPTTNFWLDSAAFREHVTAGLPAAAADALAPERLAHLAAAAELYADDFLAGFTLPDSPAFDEWQFFVRESLRQLYGQVLEQLVQAYRRQQAWEQAIPYGRRWVALDGLHEPAHRMLMRLYAWAGQHAAALRQYQECARILDAELGAAPDDETTALYEAIRTRQLAPPEATDRESGPSSELNEAQPYKRYVEEEHLAEGGQGEVYRGRDLLTGQPVAIKWLKTELAERHLDQVARFVREGAALRRLHHPNIVGILDTFEHAGRYAIVMEYVPGGSLRALLDTARPPPLSQILAIGLELADALSRAHHLGIIHRDLKPENVLLAADGTPRLTDFGLARLEWDDARLTQSGTIFGSPAYMSPEAIRGEELDARSDIWSLGVVLYELLAGRPPFEGAQVTPVLASILEDATPDLRHFRPDVSPPLVDLLDQMLVKERAERIASMRQVAAALEAIRDGRGAEGLLTQQPGAAHVLRVGTPVTPASPPSSSLASALPQVGYSPSQPTPSASRHTEQQIRFGTAPDGVRIAYATVGAGPVLLKAPNWMSHLEFDWHSPVWRHWLAELARHHTLVRYDRRGCGLSDWNVKDMSLEARVQDLETVVAALDLGRFALLGLSGGGSVAIAYAVRHPEKVSQLVLYGCYARGRLKRDLTPEQIEEVKTLRQVMQIGWGKPNAAFRQVYTTLFIPDGTPEQIHWFNDLQRISTAPEVAVRIAMADWSDDLTALARKVAVPTLVLHAREDAVVPFEEGRRLAALIPGAQFVPLESRNHVLLENEPAWRRFLDEVQNFLGEEAARPSSALGQPPAELPAHRLMSSDTRAESSPDRATNDRRHSLE